VARSKRGLGLGLGLAAAVLAVDQASKWLVRHETAHLPWRIGLGLRIELSHNPGISFSQLTGAGSLVIVLVAVVCAGVCAALWLAPPPYRPAIGIILGGALGNLTDRVLWHGAVIDFIAVSHWPTFNLADAAIVAGTVLLVVQVLRGATV
jgi:signal peptidase II